MPTLIGFPWPEPTHRFCSTDIVGSSSNLHTGCLRLCDVRASVSSCIAFQQSSCTHEKTGTKRRSHSWTFSSVEGERRVSTQSEWVRPTLRGRHDLKLRHDSRVRHDRQRVRQVRLKTRERPVPKLLAAGRFGVGMVSATDPKSSPFVSPTTHQTSIRSRTLWG